MSVHNLLVVVWLMALSAGRLALAQQHMVEWAKPATTAQNALAAGSQSAAASAPIPADVTKLVETAAANSDRNDLLGKNYTYQISTDQTFYNKHGKVEDHHTAKYDVVGLEEGEYQQLTEWNEKPISAEVRARREAALEAHERATRDKAKPRKVCYRTRLFGQRVSFPLASFKEFPAFFNMRIVGTESVHGRPAYVIEATPREDAKPADEWEKAELNFQAKLWIDIADTIPVQSHYQSIADCQCLVKGSSLGFEWQKIQDEAWLPTRSFINAKVKYFLGEKTIQVEFTSFNFRKFKVDTRIADASTQPMPDHSARTPSSSATPTSVADEAAIRSLVQKIIAAYQQRDSQTLFSSFTGNSPNLLVLKMEVESGWGQHEAVERKNLTIGDIDVSGDGASVRVSYQWSGVNSDASEVASNGENFFTLELIREAGVWKLWNLLSDAQGFAEELLAAESDQERNGLLATERSQVTKELVEVLVGNGHELMAMGQYDAARSRFNVARTVADQLHDRRALAWALYGLGHGSLVQGDEAAAADYFHQAVAIGEALGDNSELAAAYSFIGQHYAELGNYRQAMEYYRKSITASEKTGSNDLLALALASVGDVFALQGNDDQALDYYQRSEKLFVFGKTLNSIGEVLTRKGNYAQALEHYRKSFELFQDSDYFSLAAAGLRSMGDNYFLQGRLDDALDHYRRSLEEYEELDHKTGRATTLGRIANVYYQKREYDRAVEFATRARTLAATLENPSDLSSILTTLGKAYMASAKYDEAKQTLTEATSAVEKLRTEVVGSEHDQGLFFERKIDPYQAMVELFVNQHNFMEALAYAEREKGRVLLDVLRDGRANIAETMTPEERAQEQTLNQVLVTLNYELQRENVQRRPNQTVVEAIDAQLKKARLEYEAFETGLYAAHPDLRGQRGETPPLSEEELSALVSNSGTAFLEYVVQQGRTYLFVLTEPSENAKGRAAKLALNLHVIEISADELSKLVADFRIKLATNALDFREPARRLYQLLLAPAETELTGKRTVCLVPAGPLWELPFQALLTKQNRYLLEQHAVFYVPSLTVLREMRTRRAETPSANDESEDPNGAPFMPDAALPTISPQTLFAVGNPALNSGEKSAPGRPGGDGPYAPLPEQGNLVRTLGQIYGSKSSMVIIHEDATEETVKAQAGKYRILHFSTHGVLDNDNPLYSHLLLSPASAKEDGFLEAREIMQLKLQADLAVLSGCETARGRVRAGEGLMGMSWAFFVAGTPTTVASQWQVDSASTARLMIAFHRRLKAELLPAGLELSKSQALRHPLVFHRLLRAERSGSGWQMSKAEILREASLQLMSDAKYRHPFYWAGFVVMGDGL